VHSASSANVTEETDWSAVDWQHQAKRVCNLRQRIYRATKEGDWKRVHSLQKLMLRSYANRLMSVRRVTQLNQGKHTPGVDKVLIKTPAARGRLVDHLASYHPWQARPTKRVYIPKLVHLYCHQWLHAPGKEAERLAALRLRVKRMEGEHQQHGGRGPPSAPPPE
jgi:RNA-directed DNA polymerase